MLKKIFIALTIYSVVQTIQSTIFFKIIYPEIAALSFRLFGLGLLLLLPFVTFLLFLSLFRYFFHGENWFYYFYSETKRMLGKSYLICDSTDMKHEEKIGVTYSKKTQRKYADNISKKFQTVT